jgi:hypothetical protein
LVLSIELGTGELSAVFNLKLGSVLDNKLKCRAIVIAVTNNIVSLFGAGIGAVLGIVLKMEMRFNLGT